MIILSRFLLLGTITCIGAMPAEAKAAAPTQIPKLWDEEALASMTLPSAVPGTRILYVSSHFYYSIPEQPAWKSYPVYTPQREPPGYVEWLRTREPEQVFDVTRMKTARDWIKAGSLIYDTPYELTPLEKSPVREREWFEKLNPPLTNDGAITAFRYVIRVRGEIEVGSGSCASCHSRVMPNGSVIKGAQGNFPIEAAYAYALRKGGSLQRKLDNSERKQDPALIFPQPNRDELNHGLYSMSAGEIAEAYEAMIPGLAARNGFSIFDMPKIADLIGVKDRKYLDLTARLEHRNIGDLMRYAVTCAGGNYFFTSQATLPPDAIPKPSEMYRPNDAAYYALAQYVYSLKPPKNPNLPQNSAQRALVKRGRAIFEEENCVRCHTPPLYTNNKLTPAGDFEVPADHQTRYNITNKRVGTDPRSATVSLRGRGYYKVPSLLGVWYRGPFEHNGSVATLEDWFDPSRLGDDYIPTGFKGYGIKTRPVPGHEFGLDLDEGDRKALIAFLKTL